MNLDQFKRASSLHDLSEIDRTCYLAFFHLKTNGAIEFSATDAAKWLVEAGGATPNKSRLEDKLRNARCTVKANRGWRLKGEFVHQLETKFPQLSVRSQDVVDDGTILPPALYQRTRGYIESLAKQINRAYEENIFDGCAVLMRRLEEVLLILSYEHLRIDAEIKDGKGHYFLLEGIARNAEANNTLNLSRNAKPTVEAIRKLGNYSAHKVTYTCKKEYIQEQIMDFRALVDELLHKAGILK